jgi:hypothetical protein
MLTSLGAIAVAFAYLAGCALCRTCRGYADAQIEIERDASWWRGLQAAEPGDGEVRE